VRQCKTKNTRKVILLVIFFSIAGWWFTVGGRKMSEEHVRGFYRDYEAATLSLQPEALCNMLDDRFAGTAIVSMQGHIASTTQDKAETCESRHEQYAIHSITISPNRRSATVEISTSLDVGGTIMQIRSHSKDTLVRQNGLVRMQHDARGSVNMGHEKGAVPP
jgi:hypothetical protein